MKQAQRGQYESRQVQQRLLHENIVATISLKCCGYLVLPGLVGSSASCCLPAVSSNVTCRALVSEPVLCTQGPEGGGRGKIYRPIIHKGNLHHCLEDAVLDLVRGVTLLYLAQKVMVKPFRLVRC